MSFEMASDTSATGKSDMAVKIYLRREAVARSAGGPDAMAKQGWGVPSPRAAFTPTCPGPVGTGSRRVGLFLHPFAPSTLPAWALNRPPAPCALSPSKQTNYKY